MDLHLGSNRDSPLQNHFVPDFKIDNPSPIIQLLDSGNLVLRSGNQILWQRFDHPVDTLLSDMKLGWDLDTEIETYLKRRMILVPI
ncbi:S-locus-specific glycoprotein S13 [Linum perenne]